MVYGVLVLLDALGSQVTGDELKRKVSEFNQLDERVKNGIELMKTELHGHGYNDLITYGAIYDNLQVFLPIGSNKTTFATFADYSGKGEFYWALITIGELLKDIFRYSLVNNLPLRGCVSSGYGELTNTNRVLGPIANEASKYYEITDWMGITLTYHPQLVLDNKIRLNPNKEVYEPFVRYSVPTKRLEINKETSKCEVIREEKEYWVLDWVNHYAYQYSMEDDKLITFDVTKDKTPFGDIILNGSIKQLLLTGMKNNNQDIATKYLNTYGFFESRWTQVQSHSISS